MCSVEKYSKSFNLILTLKWFQRNKINVVEYKVSDATFELYTKILSKSTLFNIANALINYLHLNTLTPSSRHLLNIDG